MSNTSDIPSFKALAQQVRDKRMITTNEAKQKERDALPEMRMLLLEIKNLAGKSSTLPLHTMLVWGHLVDAAEYLETRIKAIEEEANHE